MGLVRCRGVERAGPPPSLSHEQLRSDQGSPGIELVASGVRHNRRNLANLAEIQRNRHVVKTLQRQSNLTDIRIARTLSHAADGALDPAGANSHRRKRTSAIHASVALPAREKPHRSAFKPAFCINWIASASSGDTRGKPASMRFTPS